MTRKDSHPTPCSALPVPDAGSAVIDGLMGEIDRLRCELSDKHRLLTARDAEIAHARKIFDSASAAARIGVWECDLPDMTLRWTDVVYDLFGLPRGSPIDRRTTLRMYEPASLIELEEKRSAAIAACGGFTLEARIKTAGGELRWLRITAQVEQENGTPVRIFGMKQDITEEKLVLEQIRYVADHDMLTGLANRARFNRALAALSDAPTVVPPILMLIDLDRFKAVNDTFGHLAGDACLRDVALRFRRILPGAQIVARIGGDEFAVLLQGVSGEEACRLAWAVVDAMAAPITHAGHLLTVGASIGIASGGGTPPDMLIQQADSALYAAKTGGRNTVRIFENAAIFRGGNRPMGRLISGTRVW